MNCVLVIEKDGEIRQRVPYDPENGAVMFLYDKESRIVWESQELVLDNIPSPTRPSGCSTSPDFWKCAGSRLR